MLKNTERPARKQGMLSSLDISMHEIQAKAAGKLAHFDSSASGIYDIINVCSTDNEENGDDSIQPPMRVICDMDADRGGWIVILKRKKSVFAHVNFYRPWDHYENGFGSLNTEFWLGLRNIHCLTTREDVDLMIDLREENGNGMTWIYHTFKVNGSNDKYRLQIGEAEGPPGANDAMASHNGEQFTTYDSDNDLNVANCAHTGYYAATGWWFNKHCTAHGALLTGSHTNTKLSTQLQWHMGRTGGPESYKLYPSVEMKVRPKSCAATCDKL